MTERVLARRPRRSRRAWIAAAVVLAVGVGGLLADYAVRPAPPSDRWAFSAANDARFIPWDPDDPPVPVADSPVRTPCAPQDTDGDGELDAATALSVWAHPDDDLIFMGPELVQDVLDGECVRSLFLTGGDAGEGEIRALARHRGIMAAYDGLLDRDDPWVETRIVFDSGAEASVWTPQGDTRVGVVFVDLPDGNTRSQGFAATGHVAIPTLLSGSVDSLTPVVGRGPAVTSTELGDLVAQVLDVVDPARVTTSVPHGVAGAPAGDHPDHQAAGELARAAVLATRRNLDDLEYLLGYPNEFAAANLTGHALQEKVDAYQRYSQFDPVSFCSDTTSCLAHGRIGRWLQRFYPFTDAELFGAAEFTGWPELSPH